MAGILDFLSGNVDPSDPQAVAQARAQQGLLGMAAGMLSQGPSRMPVPFSQSLGLGLQGQLAAQQQFDNTQKTRAETLLLGANTGKTGLETQALRQKLGILASIPGALDRLDALFAPGGAATPASGSAAGTPTGGAAALPAAPTTLPAGSGGVNAGSVYSYLTNDLKATPNEATLLTSAAGAESGFNPAATHDGGIGYGLFGHNGERLAAMQQTAGGDNPGWQDQLKFALDELRSRPEGALVNQAATPEQLTDLQMRFEQPNLAVNNGNYAQRLAYTRQLMPSAGGASQPASSAPTTAADAAISPEAWAALGGSGAPPANGAGAAASGAPTGAAPQGVLPRPAAPPAPAVGALLGGGTPAAPAMSAAPATPQAAGIDPRARALASLGARLSLGGMGDILKPYETAFYGSPGYKGAVAGAEANAGVPAANAKAAFQANLDIGKAGPIAEAQARGKFPFTWGRPGGVLPQVDAGGNPTGGFTTAPVMSPQVAPDGSQSQSYVQLTPGGALRTPVPGVSALGPGQTKTLENNAAVQPLTLQTPVTKAGPGYTQPLTSDAGTIIPPATAATPIQGPKEYLDDRAKEYSKIESQWGDSVQSAAEMEQRTLATAKAMKLYQTGAFASHLSELRADLKAAGINLPDSVAGDPAQAQIILKNNFGASIQAMKATGLSRWTQAELFATQANTQNPNLQPEANLALMGQTVGTLQWEQQMQRDYAQAKKFGGFLDPQDFQRQWAQANPIQPFIDKAEQQIGPLKGMSSGLPQGAQQIGTYQGKPVYQLPDGSRKVLQ